ncbi:hypothetical protein GE061_009194 [Apolygus lucorum]|uniref:Secreted protein n=1 Tax=Apolygus lucorum TaxID=248454 RepID=A0A8S9Y1L4_APOLU|nr:hypothetical protein GE061_009194 [Apolygus lucorum]
MRAGVIVGVLVCSVLVGLVESKSAHKYQNHGNRDSPEGGVAAEDHTLKNREEPVTSPNEANLAEDGKPKKHGSNEVIPAKHSGTETILAALKTAWNLLLALSF